MAVTTWDVRLYDLDGNQLTAVTQYTEPKWTIPLNGFDSVEMSLYLDDDAALYVSELDTVMKIWRSVNDIVYSKTYTPASNRPSFAGLVTAVRKQGSANLLTFTAQSPLWRMQSRFHLLPWYLVIDNAGQIYTGGNEDDLVYDQSAMLWKNIDLVSGAFGAVSYAGIDKPTSGPPFWEKTVEMAPTRFPKGSNVWTLHQLIMDRAGGIDLNPIYVHTAADSSLMFFETTPVRGTDKTGTVQLEYHTGNMNCEDFEEDTVVVPGEFANYVWVIGQGGVMQSVAVSDDFAGSYGIDTIGNYMKTVETEIVDLDALQAAADTELMKSNRPARVYTVELSRVIPPYYKTDFDLGDLVLLNAEKGALSVAAAQQRIYQIELGMSDNRVETCSLSLSDDFYSKVPPA